MSSFWQGVSDLDVKAIKEIWQKHAQLLQPFLISKVARMCCTLPPMSVFQEPYEEEQRRTFHMALALGYEWIQLPETTDKFSFYPNYFQVLNHTSTDRNPVEAALFAIFKQRDCLYTDERFELLPKLLEETLVHIRAKYATPEAYLHRVRAMIWLPDGNEFVDLMLPKVRGLWKKPAVVAKEDKPKNAMEIPESKDSAKPAE